MTRSVLVVRVECEPLTPPPHRYVPEDFKLVSAVWGTWTFEKDYGEDGDSAERVSKALTIVLGGACSDGKLVAAHAQVERRDE